MGFWFSCLLCSRHYAVDIMSPPHVVVLFTPCVGFFLFYFVLFFFFFFSPHLAANTPCFAHPIPFRYRVSSWRKRLLHMPHPRSRSKKDNWHCGLQTERLQRHIIPWKEPLTILGLLWRKRTTFSSRRRFHGQCEKAGLALADGMEGECRTPLSCGILAR